MVELIKNRFKNKKEISVLDVGCGNGRLFAILGKNIGSKIKYLGVDNNDYFLTEGMLKYDYAEFKKLDIFTELTQLGRTYDVVTCFGITHHIPTKRFRLDWFKKLAALVNPGGILAFSFWNLQADARMQKATKSTGLEENDYYYGWGNTNAKRYFHAYSEAELQELVELFGDLGLELVSTYDADGKTTNLNKYLIFALEL